MTRLLLTIALVTALLGVQSACDKLSTHGELDTAQDGPDPLGDTHLSDATDVRVADLVSDLSASDLTELGPSDGANPEITDSSGDLPSDGAAGDAPDQLELTDTIDATDALEDVGPTPFDDLEGMTDEALRAALLQRVEGHIALGYQGDGTAREFIYSILDVHDGRIECIYTGRTVAGENPDAPPIGTDTTFPPIDNTPQTDCRFPDGSLVPGGCEFNTEHTWPQGSGADIEPARSDLHHLFPSLASANTARASYAYGETACTAAECDFNEGGSELGVDAFNRRVFQVRAERQGDIARAIFYFALRYGKTIGEHQETTLRAWHAADPPDARERVRNDLIFAVQDNRNPFVDRPDFIDAIADF